MRILAMAVVLIMTTALHADFVLTGAEHIDVTSDQYGKLFGISTANITDGDVTIHVFDSATATISGGTTHITVHQDGNAIVNSGVTNITLLGGRAAMNGGAVGTIPEFHPSPVLGAMNVFSDGQLTISGGNVANQGIYVHDYGTVLLSGGSDYSSLWMGQQSLDFGRAFIQAKTFALNHPALSVNDGVVSGFGTLSGTWHDDSPFSIYLSSSNPGATVWVTGEQVPEPSSILIFGIAFIWIFMFPKAH